MAFLVLMFESHRLVMFLGAARFFDGLAHISDGRDGWLGAFPWNKWYHDSELTPSRIIVEYARSLVLEYNDAHDPLPHSVPYT
ncbi:hypothetical protein V6N11_007843 [Hibiscus sabdariffa]|uniref:Uncharacterized protein n=1 Tax=Hibiscus sabdariffa TaxID=183260 RepID=A0ABR2PZD5_9ROSI